MSLLSLKIVTPEKKIFESGEIESLTIPSETGEITILPNHIPLVSKIIPGETIIRSKGKEISMVTTDGYLKLNKKGEIVVLCDYAVRSEDLQIAKVEEAKKKAMEVMSEKKSREDFVIAEAELRKTLLELRVAQKRKAKTSI